jgi:hypothetical protein
MKLYEFAAIDGPEQTSATEMHQRIIAMANTAVSGCLPHYCVLQVVIETTLLGCWKLIEIWLRIELKWQQTIAFAR